MDLFQLAAAIGEPGLTVADLQKFVVACVPSPEIRTGDWKLAIYGTIADQTPSYASIERESLTEVAIQCDDWGVRVSGRLESGSLVRWSSVIVSVAVHS